MNKLLLSPAISSYPVPTSGDSMYPPSGPTVRRYAPPTVSKTSKLIRLYEPQTLTTATKLTLQIHREQTDLPLSLRLHLVQQHASSASPPDLYPAASPTTSTPASLPTRDMESDE